MPAPFEPPVLSSLEYVPDECQASLMEQNELSEKKHQAFDGITTRIDHLLRLNFCALTVLQLDMRSPFG